MLSYHNDPAVKATYVARFAQHRAADEVIQGQGFNNGRGCFVGCTLDDYNHAQFPVQLGWPEWLAYLADRIFEGLPKDEAPQFGTDLLDTVPVGIDLEPVRRRFLRTLQRRNLARLADNPEPYAAQCRAAIEGVIALLSEDAPSVEARSAARSAAESAAESAAWVAAWARSAAWAAESAAWAARSAAWAAESAAWAAVGAAARSAAWAAESAEYQTQRDDLLAIIRECSNT